MMYIILCYDVGAERVGRMHKTALKYLHPVQRSVFEGNLTDSAMQRMKREIAGIIEPETDAVALYCFAAAHDVVKEQIGVVLERETQFL